MTTTFLIWGVIIVGMAVIITAIVTIQRRKRKQRARPVDEDIYPLY